MLRRRLPRDAALLTHWASLLIAAAVLLYLGRHLWFFFDEWDVVGNHQVGLLQPHNEHWSTLPYLVYAGLYPFFGLHTYLPYLAVVIALHVATAHLLWRVQRRSGVDPWLAVSLTAVFLAFGAGFENLYWAWQMGFVGSVCFGLIAVLLLDVSRIRVRRVALAWLFGLAAVMSSGIGLVMMAALGLVTLLRRGPMWAAVTVAPPTAAYLGWWLLERPQSHYAQFSIPGDLRFAVTGLISTASSAIGPYGVGVVLMAALFAWLLAGAASLRREAPAALAMAFTAVFLYLLIGFGRLGLGTAEAASSRYTYIAGALLLPAAALALDRLASRSRLFGVAVAMLVLIVGVRNGRHLVSEFSRQTAVDTAEERQVLAASRILQDPAAYRVVFGPGVGPDRIRAPTLEAARVLQYVREGALPAAGGLAAPTPGDFGAALESLRGGRG